MEITWDTSVGSSNQALIQAAIDECLFDFAYIPTAWTVQVYPGLAFGGYNGSSFTTTAATMDDWLVVDQSASALPRAAF